MRGAGTDTGLQLSRAGPIGSQCSF
uniref:Uncharacterized protein n=1 Tax=Anguilla anguilla TaxID=7936 RepID=A0A0E9U683_ANGAN